MISLWRFEGLPAYHQRRETDFLRLLQSALSARPTPDESGYPVKSAGFTQSGGIVIGDNHEYGMGLAGHSEEVLIFRALQSGREDRIVDIAILAGAEGNIATPCGNCRDIIKKYADLGGVIISASPQGGLATITATRNYFYDNS